MKSYQFTFRDLDAPNRTIVTTTEGIDERWALRAALEQLQDTNGNHAWDLVSAEEVPDVPAPEETTTA